MNSTSRLLDSSPLSIRCRRCGFAERDDFEVFEANSIQSMHCVGCGTVAHFAVMECPACGGETFFALGSQPASEELRNLICAACEQRHGDEAACTLPGA